MKNKLKALIFKFFKGKVGNTFIVAIGNLLIFLQPKKARQLTESGLTLVLNDNMNIPERLMREAIFKKHEKTKDYNTIAELHQTYWTNKGTDYFSSSEDLFEKDFMPHSSFIFDLLKKELSNQTEDFTTLVEIGTGGGKVLEYLSDIFPSIDRFIGIDLSPDQVETNNKKYSNDKRLEFVASDGLDYVKKHGQGNTIFVTYGGVFEYFTEPILQEFLKEVNNLGKIFFISVEPNSPNHDFKINPHSQIHGFEWSFSHNYPKLFEDAGFRVWHFSQKPWFEGTNTQTFIGAKN